MDEGAAHAMKLRKEVEDKSYDKANCFNEWDYDYARELEGEEVDCICEKTNTIVVHYLKNKVDGTRLGPIGSDCIARFNNENLSKAAKYECPDCETGIDWSYKEQHCKTEKHKKNSTKPCPGPDCRTRIQKSSTYCSACGNLPDCKKCKKKFHPKYRGAPLCVTCYVKSKNSSSYSVR